MNSKKNTIRKNFIFVKVFFLIPYKSITSRKDKKLKYITGPFTIRNYLVKNKNIRNNQF